MPHQSRESHQEVPSATSYGQVIEYIEGMYAASRHPPISRSLSRHISLTCTSSHSKDRLFLASYTHTPDENTPFPYPAKQSRSPHKRSSRAQTGPQAAKPTIHQQPPFYFSIDRTLLYNAFHADFGPLHIGHLFRFAVQLHDVLGHPDNEDRPVVFWSHADSRSMSIITLLNVLPLTDLC